MVAVTLADRRKFARMLQEVNYNEQDRSAVQANYLKVQDFPPHLEA